MKILTVGTKNINLDNMREWVIEGENTLVITMLDEIVYPIHFQDSVELDSCIAKLHENKSKQTIFLKNATLKQLLKG